MFTLFDSSSLVTYTPSASLIKVIHFSYIHSFGLADEDCCAELTAPRGVIAEDAEVRVEYVVLVSGPFKLPASQYCSVPELPSKPVLVKQARRCFGHLILQIFSFLAVLKTPTLRSKTLKFE